MSYVFTAVVGRTPDAAYVCDGVDDQVEIQAAIDAVNAAGGGTVYLKEGTYEIANSIQLKANVDIIGSGWATVLRLKDGVNKFPLQATAANAVQNFTLRDFKVDMNGPNQTANGWVALTAIKHFTIDHVYFYNARTFGVLIQPAGDAITGDQAAYGLIHNCRFDTQVGPHDFAILNVQHSRIVNNYWGQCPAVPYPNYALSAGRSMRHTIIANNTFDNTNMQSMGLEDIQDCIVTGNRVKGSGGHGIFIKTFEPGFNVERVVVTNNICTESNDDGIALGGGPGGGRIKDSVITGNICHRNGRDGISLYGADNCEVALNHCFNNNQDTNAAPVGSGVRFSGGNPSSNTIVNNHCYDNQVTPTQNWGIHAGNGDSFIASQNVLSGNVAGQLSLAGVGNSVKANPGVNPEIVYAQGSVIGATTFDRKNGNVITATLTGNITVTLPAAIKGDELTLILTQSSGAGYTATWPSNFKKAGGVLTLTKGSGAVDIVRMVWDGQNWLETGRLLNVK